MDKAWASEYWAIEVFKIMGKKRTCAELEEKITGGHWGGRGLYGDVGYINLILHYAKTGDITCI